MTSNVRKYAVPGIIATGAVLALGCLAANAAQAYQWESGKLHSVIAAQGQGSFWMRETTNWSSDDPSSNKAVSLGKVAVEAKTMEARAYVLQDIEIKDDEYRTIKIPIVRIESGCFSGTTKVKKAIVSKNVEKIQSKAFKNSKVTTIVLKTKKLAKKSAVRGALKGSSVKTVQVKVSSKATNEKYVKAYKKVFAKSNSGKKVTVK